jgi:tetratricopeptide (TPR) repeat protein
MKLVPGCSRWLFSLQGAFPVARKKKSRRSQQKSTKPLPAGLTERLRQVDQLMFAKKLAAARKQLEELERRYPAQPDILHRLTNVYHDLKDYAAFQATCERLVAIKPSAGFTLMLAGSYLANLMPILALRTFQHFLERWPDHPRGDEARKTVADLQAHLDELLAGLQLTGPDALEVATLHEQVQSLLAQGKYPEARQKAEELLRHRPNFPAAWNNISQTYFVEGQQEQAIATARRVLETDPENIHALSNLTRYLYLSGRTDEARAYADQLKAAPPKGFDVWTKKAEALSCLGDDQAVLDVWQELQNTAGPEKQPASAFFLHLVAVAALRLGREDEARRHWNAALRRQPGFDPARANLADLRKSVGERHAPWPFPFNSWVAKKLLDDLLAYHQQADSKQADGQRTPGYLQTHPELAVLVTALLDRGDPTGREFALRTALAAKTPQMLAALRDFALSQRGPDSMRTEAATAAAEAKLLPPGPVRMWLKGEWHEILLFGFEVSDEPFSHFDHSSQVQDLKAEAMEAIHRGDPQRAESLNKQALELEPDAPDILNNLAAAYEVQGRHSEAETLLRQIHERFPDYLFGRTGMARFYIQEGRLEEAKALLDPLLTRPRFHTSEFAAVASAEIDYWLAQKNKDAARPWLEMWEKSAPESPMLQVYRQKLRPARWRDLYPW